MIGNVEATTISLPSEVNFASVIMGKVWSQFINYFCTSASHNSLGGFWRAEPQF